MPKSVLYSDGRHNWSLGACWLALEIPVSHKKLPSYDVTLGGGWSEAATQWEKNGVVRTHPHNSLAQFPCKYSFLLHWTCNNCFLTWTGAANRVNFSTTNPEWKSQQSIHNLQAWTRCHHKLCTWPQVTPGSSGRTSQPLHLADMHEHSGVEWVI